ncbi:Box C/D snoRNA protein 1 [Cyphellophora attinorum]|uniref:Box C/D snoRNA protein 1 n=1 Tax=Cyphellophora attinorum TaxID=1664694 RepID=A0A0N0NKT1_9EURO|nr:Box C/D snoRNA protein 1 [Phialophora attinorum]KPI38199.1 Box C/D snoRNA protein 1 [Phialophora attinorum]
MPEDKPLTALCAICHTGDQKYTCPRCNIHTCSLPCVKLHKVRASCSGIRDPAAYKRRADLATASSIDSDFNFITSLERSLTQADDDSKPTMRVFKKVTDSERLAGLVKERGITWRRAPKGMKRRLENHTRIENGGVSWTVEFLLPEAKRVCLLVPDSRTVGEAWEMGTAKPQKSKGGKRKRSSGEEGAMAAKKQQAASPSSDARIVTADFDQEHHFYLLRPNTLSKVKVLRPVNRTEKLIDILRIRVVMEYPTLYVKAEPPDRLGPPFMLEEKYLTEYGEDVSAPPAAPAQEPASDDEEGEVHESEPPMPEAVLKAMQDPSKVLAVLQADLKT